MEALEVHLPDLHKTPGTDSRTKKEYSPPLDTALLRSIASDFDLGDPNSLEAARNILDDIKSNAEIEEISTLEAPPNGQNQHSHSPDDSLEHASSLNGNSPPKVVTDDTSLTHSLPSASTSDRASAVGENGDAEYDVDIDSLSDEEKLPLLRDVVPGVKDFDIQFALKKHRGDFKKTLDELLSIAFLNEEHDSDGERTEVPRGVDGFAEPATKRKRKGKKRNRGTDGTRSSDSPAASADQSNDVPSVWDVPKSKPDISKQDIFYLTSRTCLSWDYVSAHYFGSGASMKQTIASLCKCDQVAVKTRTINDPDLEYKFMELGFAYWKIQPVDRQALVILAHPRMEAAYELAEVLTAPKEESYADYSAKKEIMPQYRMLDKPKPKTKPSPYVEVVKRRGTDQPIPPVTRAQQAAFTNPVDFAAKRHAAYRQAAAAYRQSRSHPVMAAVAAYYAAEGRAAAARAANQVSADARAHVAGRTTNNSVDLHGLVVKDAVGIALERVQQWWESSGEAEWAREGKAMSGTYTIVVGAGRHSDGGKAKLSPAVKKALEQKRWRVNEAAPGVLVVKGRIRF